MGRRKAPSRGHLIRNVWPDKALYGAVMLFVTGLIGIAYGLVRLAVSIDFSNNVPRLLREYPAWVTIILCGATVVFAYMSLRNRDTNYAIMGALTGIFSLGLLGVASILSVIALGYAVWSKVEREDTTLATLKLTADMWPDKSLAASLLMLMCGVITISWGILVMTKAIHLEFAEVRAYAWVALLVGLISFFASMQLYMQRGLWIGILACIGCLCALAFYGISSLLGLAALVLLILAAREDEFRKDHTAEAA